MAQKAQREQSFNMTKLLIKLFIKNNDCSDGAVRHKYGTLGGYVGIATNIILCIIKMFAGALTHSMSIIADGLNNFTDMGSSLVTMLGFKLAAKPADKDHPFGHGRMEYISAFIVSLLILLVGFELIKEAVTSLIDGSSSPKYSIFSGVVLAISIFLKFWMFLFNRYLGRKIKSAALIATAQDSLNDCISTFAILVAALITSLTNLPFNLDAVMTIAVAVFILWSGLSSAKNTLNQILGEPPEKEFIEQLQENILAFEDFIGIHDLIVHNYGPGRQFASVHVEVPQNVDIVKCHEQIDICEKVIQEKMGIMLVIHMDPIDNESEVLKNTKQKMLDAIHTIDKRLSLHDFRMTPHSDRRTNLIFDVVVPSDFSIPDDDLKERIATLAHIIDETYCCVITLDNDFTS
ncbi:MAG: cation transporter [Clostridia bacterium]|nr:cation transporter [Clostridia bacterium]